VLDDARQRKLDTTHYWLLTPTEWGHGGLHRSCRAVADADCPISRLWPQPLRRYRRAWGAFRAVAHTSYMLDHTLAWNFSFDFMPQQQLALSVAWHRVDDPAALTSFDRFQSYLGKRWRQIHLLGVPAFAEWHSYSADWFTLSR